MKKNDNLFVKDRKKRLGTFRTFWLITCFMTVTCFCGGNLLAQNTSIHVKDVTLEQVLKEMQKKSDYKFFYNSKTAQNVKGLTLDFDNAPVGDILKQALQGTGLGYAITDNTIVIRVQGANEKQENKFIEIKGTVTDKKKEPLPGASVIVKGTSVGISTDINGHFVLKVPSNIAAVTVSFIGYKPQEVVIWDTDPSKPHVYDVVLDEDSNQIDEVVVTGYQTIAKERATGSFSKVSAEDLQLRRMDNLSNMLEGQVAGYTNGQIRGITTMNAIAQPMVVIDGFPVENTTFNARTAVGATKATESMPDLNPEDIESITVLKDAAAASIYGARAANGVIVITTKRAKKGKTEIAASATFTVTPYSLYTDNLTNAADIINMEKEWAMNNQALLAGGDAAIKKAAQIRDDGNPPSLGIKTLLDLYTGKMSQAEADKMLNNLASRGYGYYDQVKEHAKRNPFQQQYNIRVGKANDRNIFNASATYWKNRSEDIYSHDDKLSINITNSLEITKWLSFDAGVYLKYGKSQTQGYSALKPGFSFLAYDQLVAEDGSFVSAEAQYNKINRDKVVQYGLYDPVITPMRELGYNINEGKDFNSRVYGKLKIDFTPWLNYNIMFQYETGETEISQLGEKESYLLQTDINSYTSLSSSNTLVYNLPNGNTHRTENTKTTAYNFRQQLNLNKTFAEKHNIVWILGNETRHSLMNYKTDKLYGYDPALLSSMPVDFKALSTGVNGILGRKLLSPDNIYKRGELLNRFVSFYSNLAYTYNDRYALSGSIRWDRSNLWGSNIKNQNKPLWSVGASWQINKEEFFHAEDINLLKLRASYGIGGNIGRNTAPYLISRYFTDYTTGTHAGYIKTPPNADIRWEKTVTINVGVDFAMFDNRLAGSIEYYNKYSSDLLANINASPTSGMGFTTLTTNNGEMSNNGMELTLRGDVIRSNAFRWNSTLLYAYNKNEVKKVNRKATSISSQINMPESYPEEGQPFQGVYAYKWAGLDAEGNPQVYNSKKEITTGPISSSEVDALIYCGTKIPPHSGTFTNVFSYNNIELSAMLVFEAGHKVRDNNIPTINMTGGFITATSKDIANRWRQTGDEFKTDVPRLSFNDAVNHNSHRSEIYSYSDKFVYDASNIRLRNISLAYRLPQNLCQQIKMSNIKLQFNVENVATIAFDKRAHYVLGGKVKPNYVFAVNLNF